MGFFDFLKPANIDRGVEDFRATPAALLLDVRSPGEYGQGHIPGSINIPLQQLDKVDKAAENKDRPLFVYCYSGSRSAQACAALRRMGYSNVNNIGGIAAYSGKVEV